MKILVDENVSTKIKEGLIRLGITDIKHINDISKGIPDYEVFELAQKENRVILTGDDDFKSIDYKYKIPIVWITPKARFLENIYIYIKWILDNINKYNINLQRAFITIKKDGYFIQYKNKDGVFGKIKTKEISFEKCNIKKMSNKP